MRHFSIVAMLVAGLSVSGCVYVPPVWDIGDAIYEVDQIEEGTTTREEVLDLLGEPDTEQEENKVYVYEGYTSAGHIIYGSGTAVGPTGGGFIDEKAWLIWIKFDENDVVRKVSAYRGATPENFLSRVYAEARAEERREYEPRALEGDAESQYQLGLLAERNESRWKWFCLAANQGHPKAQYELGNYYRWGTEPISKDLTTTYVWFSIAGSHGLSWAHGPRDDVAKEMTPSQITEAERLVAEWEPNPAECETIGVQAEN